MFCKPFAAYRATGLVVVSVALIVALVVVQATRGGDNITRHDEEDARIAEMLGHDDDACCEREEESSDRHDDEEEFDEEWEVDDEEEADFAEWEEIGGDELTEAMDDPLAIAAIVVERITELEEEEAIIVLSELLNATTRPKVKRYLRLTLMNLCLETERTDQAIEHARTLLQD